MTQCTADFELGTNTSDILTADAGSATAWSTKLVGNSAPVTYDNTHPAGGSLGAKYVITTSSYVALGWQAALGTVTDHYGRLYLYMTAYPSGVGSGDWHPLINVQLGGDATRAARFDIGGTGLIRIIDAPASGIQSGAVACALNQLVRIEWHVIHSASVGQIEAKIFNTASSSTADETITSPASWNTSASADRIFFGYMASGENFTYWLDNIIAGATSYPGPATTAYTKAGWGALGYIP